ncbi:MAG: hypothetical protein IT385_13205 [Deltaproteobacteria bacterium]|nr:hypothetical protein [Deltaproteobacteria bacterium]
MPAAKQCRVMEYYFESGVVTWAFVMLGEYRKWSAKPMGGSPIAGWIFVGDDTLEYSSSPAHQLKDYFHTIDRKLVEGRHTMAELEAAFVVTDDHPAHRRG